MTQVFLSYSRKDLPFVELLERELNGRGIVTWRDVHSIPGGARWFQRIKAGLESSYAMIYVDTPNAELSDWVEKEFMYAQALQLPILPVKIDPTFMSMVAINLNPILCVDLAVGIVKLDARLRSLPQQPIKPGALPPTEESPTGERDYLDWLLAQKKADQRDALYVELAAEREQRPHDHIVMSDEIDDEVSFVFTHVEQVTHEDFGKPGEKVTDVREAIRQLRRVVLLGDPGAGKSTTLHKLAIDLARNPTKLPVDVPLREFNGSMPFAEFVRSRLYTLQDQYEALLQNGRLLLLCDALNEMPRTAITDGRDLVAEVRDYLKDKPDWVVSCRVRDYTDDLSGITGIGKIRLKPLDPPRIHEFIQRKFTVQPERGAALWAAMRGNENLLAAWDAFVQDGSAEGFWGDRWLPEKPYSWSDEGKAWRKLHDDHRRLMPLCRSPFMANMVCALYRVGGALSDNRAGLFADFVANLLRHERERLEKVGLVWIGDEAIRAGMGQIAWALGALTEMARENVETLLRSQTTDPTKLLSAAASAGILDYGFTVRFTHQLLQQYFAASILGTLMDAKSDPAAIWQPGNWWESTGREETAILLAGDRNDPEGVARWLAAAQPEFAHELLTQPDFKIAQLAPHTKAVLIASAREKVTETDPRGRAAAYRVLGLYDADDRLGVGLRPDGLPDVEWVEIPAGEFIYGEDETQTTLSLERFWIAKYPITDVQFQAFLDAPDGFERDEWWDGLDAEYRKQPMNEQRFKFANHPRERVSWFQAIAFTRWLTWRMRGQSVGTMPASSAADNAGVVPTRWNVGEQVEIRLPTEWEWEKAARGTDGLIYPYGDTFDAAKGNTRETGIGKTSAVGLFPDGASPYGALDMSGNVWEWCLNKHGSPQDIGLNRTDVRVLRGGSWFDVPQGARAARRDYDYPDYWDPDFGFRVVLGSPPTSRSVL